MNWELILVDDGSTDSSPDLIKELSQQDHRIRSIIFEVNRGALAAIRSGFQYLSGDLFIGLAADDFLVDRLFFEHAVSEFNIKPGVSGVFGRCRVIDADDGRELWSMGSAPLEGLNSASENLVSFFDSTIFIPGASAIWRLPLVRQVGLINPDLGPQCDFFLNHALAGFGDGVVYLPRTVATVRSSPTTFSSSATTEQFFRRHALVEAKMRGLPASWGVGSVRLRNWRWGVVNARLAVTAQRPLFRFVRETVESVPPFLRSSLPQAFVEMLHDTADKCTRLEAELEAAVKRAADIFDEVAGRIDGEPF